MTTIIDQLHLFVTDNGYILINHVSKCSHFVVISIEYVVV